MVANAPKISVRANVKDNASRPSSESGTISTTTVVTTRKARKKALPRSPPKKMDTGRRGTSVFRGSRSAKLDKGEVGFDGCSVA